MKERSAVHVSNTPSILSCCFFVRVLLSLLDYSPSLLDYRREDPPLSLMSLYLALLQLPGGWKQDAKMQSAN